MAPASVAVAVAVAVAPGSLAVGGQEVVDVARPALDPGVDGAALGGSVLHGVGVEAHLLDVEPQDAVAQQPELADAVGALAEGDDAGVADEVAQGLQVVERGRRVRPRAERGQAVGVARDPSRQFSGAAVWAGSAGGSSVRGSLGIPGSLP